MSKNHQGQNKLGAMPNARKKLSSLIAASLGIGISLAAVPAVADQKDSDDSPPKTVATFSGGGYHALSGAASWMMGMMAREAEDGELASMARVTSHVDAFGSNSGGSWFMSLSAYSPTFLQGLSEGALDPARFTSTDGYMGLAWERLKKKKACTTFHPAGCLSFKDALEKAGLLGLANLLLSGDGQWQYSIENDVFGAPVDGETWPYYTEVKDQTLASAPLDWLGAKPWILAGTFLTDGPSLTYTSKLSGDYIDVQTLVGFSQTFPKESILPGGVPVMMTGSDGIDFLPTGDLTLAYGLWKDGEFKGKVSQQTSIGSGELNASIQSLHVMNAAGISSAAGGGFIDIPDLARTIWIEPKKVATELNGFAPAYQMHNDDKASMNFIADVHHRFKAPDTGAEALTQSLLDNKLVRMADGGFMDNTAAAQMLRYLQDKNGGKVPDGFKIIAFDDFPDTQTKWSDKDKTPMPTGNDVASLFGFTGCHSFMTVDKQCHIREKDQVTHTSGLLGFKFTGVSPQVFPCDEYFTKGKPNSKQTCAGVPDQSKLFWYPDEDEKVICDGKEQPLTYAKYDVTIDEKLPGSRLYGINASDAKGTVHVFSTLGKGAAVVPGNEKGMACYSKLVETIVANVKKTGGNACDTSKPKSTSNKCTLGDYLEAALN